MPVRAHWLCDPREGRLPLGRQRGAFEAGDTDYVGPGHTPILCAGTEVAEVSPSEDLGRTMEVAIKNVEEMEASA